MKKIAKLFLACAFGAALLLTGGTMRILAANSVPKIPDPYLIQGAVTQTEGSRLFVNGTNSQGFTEEMIINTSDHTRILNGVTGNPEPLDSIQAGDVIYAYIGPAVTLSLPPIANATLILTDIPEDSQVPEFLKVQSMDFNENQTEGTLTATNGQQYFIPADCSFFPYLTRNIVTIHDLTPGTVILLWTKPDGASAGRIMIFPEREDVEAETPAMQGWTEKDGRWYYYEPDGTLFTGWLNDGGKWYYLDPSDGAMRTGFLTIGDDTYYLQDNGQMLTSPRTFTPDSNGVLH